MSEMRKFISVLRLFFLDFSRDKITVFFTLAFPIILLLIFQYLRDRCCQYM